MKRYFFKSGLRNSKQFEVFILKRPKRGKRFFIHYMSSEDEFEIIPMPIRMENENLKVYDYLKRLKMMGFIESRRREK